VCRRSCNKFRGAGHPGGCIPRCHNFSPFCHLFALASPACLMLSEISEPQHFRELVQFTYPYYWCSTLIQTNPLILRKHRLKAVIFRHFTQITFVSKILFSVWNLKLWVSLLQTLAVVKSKAFLPGLFRLAEAKLLSHTLDLSVLPSLSLILSVPVLLYKAVLAMVKWHMLTKIFIHNLFISIPTNLSSSAKAKKWTSIFKASVFKHFIHCTWNQLCFIFLKTFIPSVSGRCCTFRSQ